MTPKLSIGGIILCGGRSSRMGRSKAWLPFGNELMLPRVARILKTVVTPVVVVAAPGQEVPPLADDIAIVRDEAEGRGPLQGLAAGLAALEGQADAAYLSSCDVPFLMPDWIRRMCTLLGAYDICVPRVDDYYHTLAGVYRLSVLNAVRELLETNRLRPRFLYDALPTRVVTAAELCDIDPTLQSLRNLNAPEDYAAALRDLKS